MAVFMVFESSHKFVGGEEDVCIQMSHQVMYLCYKAHAVNLF